MMFWTMERRKVRILTEKMAIWSVSSIYIDIELFTRKDKLKNVLDTLPDRRSTVTKEDLNILIRRQQYSIVEAYAISIKDNMKTCI